MTRKKRIAIIARGILRFRELNGLEITEADKQYAMRVAAIAVSMWDALTDAGPGGEEE